MRIADTLLRASIQKHGRNALGLDHVGTLRLTGIVYRCWLIFPQDFRGILLPFCTGDVNMSIRSEPEKV